MCDFEESEGDAKPWKLGEHVCAFADHALLDRWADVLGLEVFTGEAIKRVTVSDLVGQC